jgi:hypothetical protein
MIVDPLERMGEVTLICSNKRCKNAVRVPFPIGRLPGEWVMRNINRYTTVYACSSKCRMVVEFDYKLEARA